MTLEVPEAGIPSVELLMPGTWLPLDLDPVPRVRNLTRLRDPVSPAEPGWSRGVSMEHETPTVVRPTSGSPSLRKNASIRLEHGAIVATDRRGRTRTFPIDGTENAPRGFRGTGQLDGLRYLENQGGRALVRIDLMDWDPEQLGDLEDAAGFKVVTDPGTPTDRPEMMKIEDPPYFPRAGASAAVGIGAVSLYWLHVAPEAVMLLVALPALILFAWFITLTKLAMPSGKQIQATQERAAELAPQALAEADEILKRYGVEPTREPKADKPPDG